MIRRFLLSTGNLLLLLIIFKSLTAQAYQGAVSGATAQSGRAALETTDTPFMNPAGVAHIRGYYFASTFSTGALEPEINQKEYSLTLIDNMNDTLIPTSLGFNETVRTQNDRTDVRKDFVLSLAYPLGPKLSMGLGLKYQDDFFIDRYRQSNASLGALWMPNQKLAFALVFENLIGQDPLLPATLRQRPGAGAGIAYLHSRVVRMKADVNSSSQNSLNKPTVSIGVESFLTQWVLTRIGIQRNQEREANLYTGGFGFLGPKFSANYAFLRESINNEARHAVDLTIPLW